MQKTIFVVPTNICCKCLENDTAFWKPFPLLCHKHSSGFINEIAEIKLWTTEAKLQDFFYKKVCVYMYKQHPAGIQTLNTSQMHYHDRLNFGILSGDLFLTLATSILMVPIVANIKIVRATLICMLSLDTSKTCI